MVWYFYCLKPLPIINVLKYFRERKEGQNPRLNKLGKSVHMAKKVENELLLARN